MIKITTHVLNTSKGIPGSGIGVVLYFKKGNDWEEIAKGITNDSGRVPDFQAGDRELVMGIYKLRFDTDAYFKTHFAVSFYPLIEIIFNVSANEHYHVPLLLNPFGYSTYRGS